MRRLMPQSESSAVDPHGGAQSCGFVPVAGSVASQRCGSMQFAVQAEKKRPIDAAVVSSSNSSSVPSAGGGCVAGRDGIEVGSPSPGHGGESVTFHIACASEESAKHGVLVGIAPPDVRTDTTMVWDEPGACMLNCSSSGATLWSDSLGMFGVKVSDTCLVRSGTTSSSSPLTSAGPFVGDVRLQWNAQSRNLSFSVLPAPLESEPRPASTTTTVHVKQGVVDLASALPTVSFTTVVTNDQVSISELLML